MRAWRRLRRAVANPVMTGYYACSRINPGGLLERYQAKARNAGLDRPYLILSFDCDRPHDAEAAWDVHVRLMEMGICPAYAVPGELLAKAEKSYRKIAATGAEFLNHGYRWHMYLDRRTGIYESCFFYDQLPAETIEADVTEGDRAVTEIIGVKPRGFRTPHFGTFQRDSHLRFLHQILRKLGYVYSTSTLPVFGLRHGPLFRRYGLVEIPVSGRGSSPFELLDSWSCFEAPGRVLGPQDYAREATQMAERLGGGAGLLNYYADPSHIAAQPIFFETMRQLVAVAQPTTYQQIVARFACASETVPR